MGNIFGKWAALYKLRTLKTEETYHYILRNGLLEQNQWSQMLFDSWFGMWFMMFSLMSWFFIQFVKYVKYVKTWYAKSIYISQRNAWSNESVHIILRVVLLLLLLLCQVFTSSQDFWICVFVYLCTPCVRPVHAPCTIRVRSVHA